VLFLERTNRTKVEDDFGLEVRKLSRWTRPCFSRGGTDASIDLPRHGPDPQVRLMLQRPTPELVTRAICSFLSASEAAQIQGKRTVTQCLDGGGVVNLEPFWERPAGPKHIAPNKIKAKTKLRYPRQGLVRVPESILNMVENGEKQGRFGGAVPPSISESSGFQAKKLFERANFSFVPLFTGQLFILLGLALARLR